MLFLHGQTYNYAAKVDLFFEHKARLVSLRDALIAAGHAKAPEAKEIFRDRERQFIQDRVSELYQLNKQLIGCHICHSIVC